MTAFTANLARSETPSVEQQVDQAIQQRLAQCPYAFFFCRVTRQFDNGRLTLRGSVPSFYLRQNLQQLLYGVDHVREIINEVDVVSCNGLSSVRPKQPR